MTQSSIRSAIYTRKSSDEGLEQDFNSLEAQREACEAYIKSQAHEGWRLLPERFDDGGFSGGSLERPSLQRLLDRVRANRVDVIVIYKIDRLTRSLTDFARLAEIFDRHGVSFVSVTQAFNTTTSMGRLTLNVLLSFAQFEREITGERIRDKIAASKQKGMWTGGTVPLGYDVIEKKLVINEGEAETVRMLFRLYQRHGNLRTVIEEAERLGLRSKKRIDSNGRQSGGLPFLPGPLHHLLRNPVYAGRIRHRRETYPGLHQPIVDPDTWEAVQRQLALNRNGERSRSNARNPSPLTGLIFDATGNRLTPSHAIKPGRRYRYYVNRELIHGGKAPGSRLRRIPAVEIEGLVRQAIADLLDSPVQLLDALGGGLDARESRHALCRARKLSQELADSTSTAWASHARSLLQRVVIDDGQIRLHIGRNGLRAALSLPAPESKLAAEGEAEADYHVLVIPARIGLRGNQMKLIVAPRDETPRRKPDAALIKAVARAHDWFERLRRGEVASVKGIARAEGVTASYVSRVLRLAFLAPDIIEAITDGRQPSTLTAERLLVPDELPLDWPRQRAALGFAPR